MLNHVAIKIGTLNTFTALKAVHLSPTSALYTSLNRHADAYAGRFIVVVLEGEYISYASIKTEEELKSYGHPLTYIY